MTLIAAAKPHQPALAHVEPAHPGADFSDTDARDIAHIAQSRGWQVAAHEYMRGLDERAYRLAVDEYGAQLRFLLPLTPESRVLQMRSGWGAITLNIADCSNSVVAIDDRLDRLRFLEVRCEEEARSSIEMVCSHLSSGLPFPDCAFDAVLLFDALEKVETSQGTAWQENQLHLLEELHRVLRSGGSLLLSASNRLGFARVGASGVQHLRTWWGYRSLLESAGFCKMQFYAPLPSHLEPFFIMPLGQSSLLSQFVDWIFTAQDYRSKLAARGMGGVYRLAWGLWRAARYLRVAGLARYVMPSYLILVEKEIT